jgi:hypothetical protein
MTLRRRLRRSFKRIGAFIRSNMGGALNNASLHPSAHFPPRGAWETPLGRQLLPALATPIAAKLGSPGATDSQKEASASAAQGYPTANIVVEPESPGNPRSLFRIYAFGRIYEEGLTAAQTHVLVGDFLETLILPRNSSPAYR